MDSLFAEVVLVVLCGMVWIGPLVTSIRRGMAVLAHPTGFFPAYLYFTVLVAMTEHWFGWSGRATHHGIRMETRHYEHLPWFFTKPLLIFLVVGLAYNYGVRKGAGALLPSQADRVHLDSGLPAVRGTKARVITAGWIFSCIYLLPFAVLGQGSGYFWTLGMLFAVSFVPVLVMPGWQMGGQVMWLVGMPAMLVLDSKGNFIYHLLPLALFRQGHLWRDLRGQLSFRRASFILGVVATVVVGTVYLTDRRGELIEGVPLIYNIVIREYGFEVFAIMVHKIELLNHSWEQSWLLLELSEVVPASLLPWEKVRAGVEVAEQFMGEDSRALREAGFYRFFCFAAYHDFGWLGAIGFGGGVGWLFGVVWRRACIKAQLLGALWPVVAVLPVAVFAQYLAGGALAFFLIFAATATVMVRLFACVTDRHPGAARL